MVEALPGGLLDLMAPLAAVPRPVRRVRTWQHLQRQSARLVLPDGVPLAPVPRPAGREDGELAALARVVLDLWNLRLGLPPRRCPDEASARRSWRLGRARWRETLQQYLPGRPGLRPHLDLLLADLAARVGRPGDALDLLQQARQGFAVAGDVRGAAAAATVAGDWGASGHVSPAVWGFALVDGESGRAGTVARLERPRPADPAGALRWYGIAEQLYGAAGDARGAAVVLQRRAYLAGATGRPGPAARQADEAARRLRAAGDGPGARLAQLQAVLARLADGERPDPAELLAPALPGAGGPGQSDGPAGRAHAIGLGLLLGRAGTHWLTVEDRPEPALAAFRAGEEVWARLGDEAARARSRAEQAAAAAALGRNAGTGPRAVRAAPIPAPTPELADRHRPRSADQR